MSINFSHLALKPFLTENMQNRIRNTDPNGFANSVSTFFKQEKSIKEFLDFLDYGSKHKGFSFAIIKFLIGEYSIDKLKPLEEKFPKDFLEMRSNKQFLNVSLSKMLSTQLKSGSTIHDSANKASEKLKLLRLLFLSVEKDANEKNINEIIDDINIFHHAERTHIINMLNRVNNISNEEFLQIFSTQDINTEDWKNFIELFSEIKSLDSLNFIKFLIGEYSIDKLGNLKSQLPKSLLENDKGFLKLELSKKFARFLKSGKTVHDCSTKAQQKLQLLSYKLVSDENIKKKTARFFDDIGFDNKLVFLKNDGIGICYTSFGIKSYIYLGNSKNAIPEGSKGKLFNARELDDYYSEIGDFKDGKLILGAKKLIYKKDGYENKIEKTYNGFFEDKKITEGELSINIPKDGNAVEMVKFNGKFKDYRPDNGKLTIDNYTFNGIISRPSTKWELYEGNGSLEYKNNNKVWGKVLNLIDYGKIFLEPEYLNTSKKGFMYFIIKDNKKFLKVNNSRLYLKNIDKYCFFTGLLDEKGEPSGKCSLEFDNKMVTATFKDGKVESADIYYESLQMHYQGAVGGDLEPHNTGTYTLKNGDKINGFLSGEGKNKMIHGDYFVKQDGKKITGYFDFNKVFKINSNLNIDCYSLLVVGKSLEIVFKDKRKFSGKKQENISSNGIYLINGKMLSSDKYEICFGTFNYLNGFRDGECTILSLMNTIVDTESLELNDNNLNSQCIIVKSGTFKNDCFKGINISRVFYKNMNEFKKYIIDGINGTIILDRNTRGITKTGHLLVSHSYKRKVELEDIDDFFEKNKLPELHSFLKKYLSLEKSGVNLSRSLSYGRL